MIKITKALLITSLAALALTACGGDSGSKDGDASSAVSSGYTADATAVAVEQCTQSGASKEMCECVTKEIQSTISADEMSQIEADMLAGKAISDEFAQASAAAGVKCMQAQN